MIDFGDGREERMFAFALEMKLRANPQVMARRTAYYARVRAARAFARTKSKAFLITILKWHCPAYLEHILMADSEEGIQDRFAYTFQGSFDP